MHPGMDMTGDGFGNNRVLRAGRRGADLCRNGCLCRAVLCRHGTYMLFIPLESPERAASTDAWFAQSYFVAHSIYGLRRGSFVTCHN